MSSYTDQQPYFSFGVIADVQYADRNDGLSGWLTMRYYRHSCIHLRSAIEHWNMEDTVPKFVLQLGDIIDGSNRKLLTSEKSLDTVLKEIENAKMPFHHIWGNHELYNFNRDYLKDTKLNTTWMQDKQQNASHEGNPDTCDYYAYHFSPHTKFRFILIDTYDLSVHGRSVESPSHQKSEDFLDNSYLLSSNGSEKPHLREFNGGMGSKQLAWLDQVLAYSDKNNEKVIIAGSEKPHLREFNGGMGSKQLAWLDQVLAYSDKNNEKVIIAGHVPIHPAAKPSYCLAWNYEDILKVIRSHKSAVCYLAGHDHSGGYYLDSYGLHHITMEGVIESPPGTNSFGTVYVYEDGMVLRGRGRVKERILPYRTHTKHKDACFKCSCASATEDIR